MDGLGRAIGAPIPIMFEGEDLLLDGVTVGDFGTIEQHLLSERPNPLALAREQSMEFIEKASTVNTGDIARDAFLREQYLTMSEKLMAEAMREGRKRNHIPAGEISEWISSVSGFIFMMWLKLHQRYPGKFSRDAVARIVQSMYEEDRERLRNALNIASGLDELGNLTGPAGMAKAAGPIGETS